MVRIELRVDGWFEAGEKDPQDSISHQIYLSKQTLKKELEGINVPDESEASKKSLEFALQAIPSPPHFKECPYLRDNQVLINTHGLPGTVYLGEVVD